MTTSSITSDAIGEPSGAPSGDPSVDDAAAPYEGPEPSIFLISLHIIMWTTLGCGLIMAMVVAMLNW